MVNVRTVICVALVITLATAWWLLGDGGGVPSVDGGPGSSGVTVSEDGEPPAVPESRPLAIDAPDEPSVLEAVGRGRLVLTSESGCGAVPGVALTLRSVSGGKARKAFGRFSKWEWGGLRSGDYDVWLDPMFADVWTCENQVIHVARDERVETTIALSSTTRIAGRIVDGVDESRALQNVVFDVITWRADSPGDEFHSRLPVAPSASGRFCIAGLRLPSEDVNRLRVVATADGYIDTRTSEFTIDRGTAFDVDELDIRFNQPTKVTGTITDPTGRPLSHVIVRATPETRGAGWVATDLVRTDLQGRYDFELNGVFRGTIDVADDRFEGGHSELLAMTAGESHAVDLVVEPIGRSIAGRITLNGDPAVEWNVAVMSEFRAHPFRSWREKTSAEGMFMAVGVSPGSYQVFVSPPNEMRAGLRVMRRVHVGDDEDATFELDVQDGRGVLVYVTLEGAVRGLLYGVLYDPERQVFAHAPRMVDSPSLDLRGLVSGDVVLAVYGGSGDEYVHAVRTVEFADDDRWASVRLDLSSSTLRVKPSEVDSTDTWKLVAATDDDLINAYINRESQLVELPVDSEITIHGLPPGRYTLHREGRFPRDVPVVISDSTVEVTAP